MTPPDDSRTPSSLRLLAGLLGRVVGDAVFAGRLLSLAAVFATGMLIGLAVRQFDGSAGGALVGGVWYVATMGRFFTDYVPSGPGR